MNSESGRAERERQARLRAALRENLKRRKSQAKGRSGRSIVTPEDDAAVPVDGNAPDASRSET